MELCAFMLTSRISHDIHKAIPREVNHRAAQATAFAPVILV